MLITDRLIYGTKRTGSKKKPRQSFELMRKITFLQETEGNDRNGNN